VPYIGAKIAKMVRPRGVEYVYLDLLLTLDRSTNTSSTDIYRKSVRIPFSLR